MRFELSGFFSLVSMALLVNPTSAVNVSWYTSTTCSGTSVTTYNVPQNTCTFSGGAGSAYIWTLPAGAKGQIYSSSSSCSSYVGETPTSGGGLCAIGKSGTTIRAANWFYPFKKLARKEVEVEEPQRTSVTFERKDGTIREVEIPAGEIDKAWKLVLAEDFEALEKYPDVSNISQVPDASIYGHI